MCGYINFRAFGGFADRFINLCIQNKIPLWDIRNIDGRISASTTISGYLSIKGPARKSGMKTLVTEKKGLIFFLKKHKKRVGILLGAVISAVIITVLTQFVWSISVIGNTDLSDEYILSAFEKHGVKVGMPISEIDLVEIAAQVSQETEELSWTAVNRKGSALVIEVKERVEKPEMYDSQTPTNLVASEDGLILSIDILYGSAEVKVGSAVTKGDLLINGVILHRDNSETLIHADGHVKALTKKHITASSSDFSVFSPVNSKKRKVLFFFGMKIPLGKSVPESFFTQHNSFLESGEKLLPLGIITQHGASFSETETEITEKMQNKLALFSCALYAESLLDCAEIRRSNVGAKTEGNGIFYDFYAECEQEIGTLQEIYVEKTSDIA